MFNLGALNGKITGDSIRLNTWLDSLVTEIMGYMSRFTSY